MMVNDKILPWRIALNAGYTLWAGNEETGIVKFCSKDMAKEWAKANLEPEQLSSVIFTQIMLPPEAEDGTK